MPEQATITYLDNSGFCCAVGSHLLIFDYYNDEAPRRELSHGVVTRAEIKKYERISVFVSHSHADHFNPAIYGWKGEAPVEYFISSELPEEYEGHRFTPGATLTLEDMKITAFDSTDLGVAFLVETGGFIIFHAGDLNWWHWREESTPAEIDQAERDFKAIMEQVVKTTREITVDIAFFPLDPRQRSYYDAGASFFLLSVRPKLFVPMHFTGRYEIIRDFARRNQSRHTKIYQVGARGEQYVYVREQPEARYYQREPE